MTQSMTGSLDDVTEGIRFTRPKAADMNSCLTLDKRKDGDLPLLQMGSFLYVLFDRSSFNDARL